MTLQQVSELVGLGRGLLSKIETSVLSSPIATLAKIAEALDLSIVGSFEWSTNYDSLVYWPKNKRQSARGRRTSSNYVYELWRRAVAIEI